MNCVWRHSASKPADRCILLSLADIADDHGQVFPRRDRAGCIMRGKSTTYKDIAQRCNTSEKSIQRAIQRLIEAGELEITVASTQGRPQEYQILLPELDPLDESLPLGLDEPDQSDTKSDDQQLEDLAGQSDDSGNSPPQPPDPEELASKILLWVHLGRWVIDDAPPPNSEHFLQEGDLFEAMDLAREALTAPEGDGSPDNPSKKFGFSLASILKSLEAPPDPLGGDVHERRRLILELTEHREAA